MMKTMIDKGATLKQPTADRASSHMSLWWSSRVVVYVLLLGSVAAVAYYRPQPTFDRYLYAAAAASLNSSDAKEIHDQALRRANWGLDYPHTSFTDDIFNNPAHMARQLPFYTIRPAYIWLIRYVPMRAVSPAAYFLLGMVILAWTQSVLWSGLLMLIGPAILCARMATPDELSALIVVSGFVLLVNGHEMPAIALLLASITVRTDNVIFLLGVCLWMVFAGRLSKIRGTFLAIAGIFLVAIVNRFAGNYGWGVLMGHSFTGGFLDPAAMRGYYPTLRQYLTYLSHAIRGLPFTVLGMWAILATYAWIQNQRARAIILVVAAFNVAHVLLFPIPEDRYFVASYLITAAVAAPIGPLRERMQSNKLA